MPFFGVRQFQDPPTDFQKIDTFDYVGDHTRHAKTGVNRFKGGVSAHAWNCHPQASIFFFFYVSCASLQVGPLDQSSQLTTQMTCSGGHYVLFMVSLIRKIFSLFFYIKMWKIALRPTGTLNSYNFGIVEDTYKLFAPNRGFLGSRNRMVLFKFTLDWPLLLWQPTIVISTQNWL